MAISLVTNVASMRALSQVGEATRAMEGALGRFSSGLRVREAADDASGMARSEELSAIQRSTVLALRNANDGIRMLQVAEVAVEQISEMLKRMRELAVQSSSGTLSADDRDIIQSQNVQLRTEIERLADNASYNGMTLFDAARTFGFQVGVQTAPAYNEIPVTLGDLQTAALGVDTLDLSTAATAFTGISAVDDALDTVMGVRSSLGAGVNRLGSALRLLESNYDVLSGAQSRLRDASVALEGADVAKLQFMQQQGIAVLAQAKNMNRSAVSLIA